ncbi:MAG TPA: hypothetical protein PK668_08590 [Myxococcota bacterium]|nr:hypothetical protein [Myxococcota bacterium]HRY92965.1 hypothetical protein [Myxococcota bacterium]HSA22070.1 hypothetical protein [Myxococcota bacterium]
MRLPSLCCSLLVLLTVAGCGPERYFIPAREARRAAEALRAGDETVVRGVEPDGREVRLRLRAGDWFTVTHPGYEHESGGPELLARVADADRVEVEPDLAGHDQVFLGLGILGGSLLRGVIAAATQGEAMSFVPFAGPIFELQRGRGQEEGLPDNGFVALSAISLAVQAVGLAVLVWGCAVWEPERGSPFAIRF